MNRETIAKTRSLGGAISAAALGLVGALMCTAALADGRNDVKDRGRSQNRECPNGREIALVNGRIHTMDSSTSVVSAVTIRNHKFAVIGPDRGASSPECRQVIDLKGRTAVPGLIDNHNHIVLLGLRPGYHTPIETAASFKDIAAVYRDRIRAAPPAAFITSIGGFNPVQLAEKRLPNLTELDAIAPRNPVYLQVSFTGPATTNTAGRRFFLSKGVAVGVDGSIAADAPTVAALTAMRAVQTFDDKKRGTRDAMAYSAALGVTSNYDMGGFLIPGSPHHEDEFAFDGAAGWDPYTAYDPLLDLHRDGRMTVRVRVFFLSMDNAPALPILTRRVNNAFRGFGDDWLRVSGLGEFITNWPVFGEVTTPPNYAAAINKAAERGWMYQQHTLSSAEDDVAITSWEALNTRIPIAPLRWSIGHALKITPANLARLKALGGAVAPHGIPYLAGTPTENGPPYRTIVDSGVKVGAGSDSAQISTLNPWLMLYYMTTGRNSAGTLINAGQRLTRKEALRLYTAENGWFAKEEDKIGSIEEGKLADLVVLNNDYFSVRDDALKQLGSVLTIVDGRIVHNTGVLQVPND